MKSNSDLVTAIVSKVEHFASPAALRNATPLATALKPFLPPAGVVLEIASGSGFHAAVLAAHFEHLNWQPTERETGRLSDIRSLTESAGLENLLPPQQLDATTSEWSVREAQAVLCLNMMHITPWSVAKGLMQGAGNVLAANAPLFIYGPFQIDGQHTAPSNAAFDQNLRTRNPDWGVRDAGDVDRVGELHGLAFEQTVDMPANNMVRIYRKRG
ncbi:MAG: DUF938 domain-containing protein [Rhodospirillaceae bacterium]|jgi:hypothetical protein|nr:DUF938 domain-containing protein [Rhodospirillaceae bacterium]